jgi:hypothetical protein
MRTLAFTVACAIGLCGEIPASRAEATVTEFFSLYDKANLTNKHTLEQLASAMETGISWADVEIARDNATATLYCPPHQLALTGSQVVDMVRRQRAKTPKLGTVEFAQMPFGLAILVSLQHVFPCRENSK